MPSSDILILHDDELSSCDDVMVYLIGFSTSLIGELLVFPLDELLRVIPAPGTLYLSRELLLKPPEAFRFSDRYVECLSFRGSYRRLYAEIYADVRLILRAFLHFMLRDIACEHEIYVHASGHSM